MVWLSDIAAPPVRVTRDVDTIVEVASLPDYHRLAAALRAKGFREDTSLGAPICRWTAGSVILDVMPSDPDVLGFGNEWYASARAAAARVELPSGERIRIVTAPYFLATKLAAFRGRGNEDYFASRDMEDIISVLDGRLEIVDEVGRSEMKLREHLTAEFAALLQDEDFMAALPGHLPGDAASQERVPLVIERIEAIAGKGE